MGQFAVPKVAGLIQAAAVTALNGDKLNLGKVMMQASNTVPKGNVISSNPVADQRKRGLSSGPDEYPNS
jgi:beta-lactam-binding protein with PASTA domain